MTTNTELNPYDLEKIARLRKNIASATPKNAMYAVCELANALTEIERLQSKLTRLTDFLEKMFPGAEWMKEFEEAPHD